MLELVFFWADHSHVFPFLTLNGLVGFMFSILGIERSYHTRFHGELVKNGDNKVYLI